MRVFYDAEFLEDGETIDPISFGFVGPDGDELYRIVANDITISRAIKHPWLRENVIPHLPVTIAGDKDTGVIGWEWDEKHPDWPCVKPRSEIADDVRQFLQAYPDLELWAWFGAYDHVVLMQLWGAMVDKPEGIPMYTNDLRQLVRQLGNPEIPKRQYARQPDDPAAGAPPQSEHNALMDAWDNEGRFAWLKEHFADRPDLAITDVQPRALLAF